MAESPEKHRRPPPHALPPSRLEHLSRLDRFKLWAKQYRTEIAASSASVVSIITTVCVGGMHCMCTLGLTDSAASFPSTPLRPVSNRKNALGLHLSSQTMPLTPSATNTLVPRTA